MHPKRKAIPEMRKDCFWGLSLCIVVEEYAAEYVDENEEEDDR
jgi:hypothetical protein